MEKSKEVGTIEFQNPLAVIQAALDLLNKDPDNLEKIKMVCGIIKKQVNVLASEVSESIVEDDENEKAQA